MFRAHRAHHQETQIVSIQALVAVGGRVVCRLGVNFQPDFKHDEFETCRELKIKINRREFVGHAGHLPRNIT